MPIMRARSFVPRLRASGTVAGHGGFVVKNEASAASLRIQQHAAGNGKLIALNEYQVNGHLIVRVPSARTREFLRAIVGHVVFLDQRNFSAHDAQFDLLRQQLTMIRNQQTQAELGDAVEEGGACATKPTRLLPAMRSGPRAMKPSWPNASSRTRSPSARLR